MTESDWVREQWPIYHRRISDTEDRVIKTEIELEIEHERHSGLRRDFDEHKRKMFGNGEKGYVDRRIQEELTEQEKRFAEMVKNAINAALQEIRKEEADRVQKLREKWDARSWGIIAAVLLMAVQTVWAMFFR